MSKPKKSPAPAAAPPDDRPVRLSALMTLSQRNRIRVQAIRAGETVEKMATRWLMERLEMEEGNKKR